MKINKLHYILFVLLAACLFASCSDDDISLSDYSVDVPVNSNKVIYIEKDNGGCSIESEDESIAKATIDDNKVTISGISQGQTNVFLKDRIGKKATIRVNVTE